MNGDDPIGIKAKSGRKPLGKPRKPTYIARKDTKMAHALQIDTLAFTKKLREAGAEEGLAEAIVEGLTAADTSELATKGDLAEVKVELKQDILKVENKIDKVKAELKADNAEVKLELKTEIAEVKTEIAEVKSDILKWMFGAIIAQTGIILAVVKFL